MNIIVYFPALPDQAPDEKYQITLKNNQTGQVTLDSLSSGEYKKELQGSAGMDNSLYEICFSVESRRLLDPVLISYQSEYIELAGSSALREYPAGLLRDSHLESTHKLIRGIEEAVVSTKKKEMYRARRSQ